MSFAARGIRSLKRVAKRSPSVRKIYYGLTGLRHRARLRGAVPGGGRGLSERVDPKKLVWIFCTSRSGSTWLRSMLKELTGGEVWEEPKVGQLFGEFYHRAQREQRRSANFVMGDPTQKVWLRSLRNFVLDTAGAAQPALTPERYLVVKEPDGAVGAPLLMRALPESRMILLVRDPRDVAASALDGMRRGNWMHDMQDEFRRGMYSSDNAPDRFVRGRANVYVKHMGNARRAYDAHRGPKALVRYEDLRADTQGTMRRLCEALEIPFSEERLARTVEKHSWESIPEKEKGEGKFYRKARPGGWREDLTPEQARIVEEVTGPLLKEFYSS